MFINDWLSHFEVYNNALPIKWKPSFIVHYDVMMKTNPLTVLLIEDYLSNCISIISLKEYALYRIYILGTCRTT